MHRLIIFSVPLAGSLGCIINEPKPLFIGGLALGSVNIDCFEVFWQSERKTIESYCQALLSERFLSSQGQNWRLYRNSEKTELIVVRLSFPWDQECPEREYVGQRSWPVHLSRANLCTVHFYHSMNRIIEENRDNDHIAYFDTNDHAAAAWHGR